MNLFYRILSLRQRADQDLRAAAYHASAGNDALADELLGEAIAFEAEADAIQAECEEWQEYIGEV